MRAAVEGIDQGAGRELGRETAALAPETSMAAELKP
jgi:hypothetical protein